MITTNEMSLGDLYLQISDYLSFVRKKWLLVLLFLLLTIGGGLIFYLSSPLYYSAKLTYLVEGSSGGASSAILSQLGLGGGGGTGPNIDRVVEIAKSDQVGLNVLKRSVKIEGGEDFLGNHILEATGMRQEWIDNDSPLAEIRLRDSIPADSTRFFSQINKALLQKLYRGKEPLVSFEPNTLTSIVSVTVNTEGEELSIVLANTVFDELNRFYNDKLYGKQIRNLELSEQLSDSLKRELDQIQFQISKVQDQASNLILSRDQLRLQRLRQDEARVAATYGEAYKQSQIAAFSLRNQSTSLEIIDRPFAPIYPSEYPLSQILLIAILTGVLLALVLIFLLYLRRKILEDVAIER